MNNKNILKYICIGAISTTAFNYAFAEEAQNVTATPSIEWTGYLDFYYQASPEGHYISASGPRVLEGRAFDRHVNQMTLNMAEVSMKKAAGKVTFKADLAAGEMVDQLSGGSSQVTPNPAANESTRNVTQATLTYAASDRLSVTAGKFYTHLGLEVTKAKDNWQYSRSYTFNYGIPFWHEGVSVNYAIVPKQLAATVYFLNAWDGRISQKQNESSTVGLNLNYTGVDDLTVNYNYLGGAETADKGLREVHELNATYKINETFSVAMDYVAGSQKEIATLGDVKWSGAGLYLKAKVNDLYTVSPRYEVFDDSDNGFAISGGLAAAGVKQKITSWTLANNFNLNDGLEARLELRADKSDTDSFFKEKGGSATDSQQSYTAALLYSF